MQWIGLPRPKSDPYNSAGINSLAVLVQETMALDPFAPAVFAFCNRCRDRMKLLLF
ncbi:IS66 family insertion sequence element accessory protein TnpB [Rhizobium ruizarguesonis]